jgi:hypothetical protein
LVWLGRGGALEQLRGRGGAAPAEQLEPALVQVVGITAGVISRIAVLFPLHRRLFSGTGILAAGWSF